MPTFLWHIIMSIGRAIYDAFFKELNREENNNEDQNS